MVPKISAVDAEAKCRRLPLLILVAALFLLLLLLTAGSFCSFVAALLGISAQENNVNFHEKNYNETRTLCLGPQGTIHKYRSEKHKEEI